MKYKLLKDLPMAKVGTIVLLEQENEGLFYIKEGDDCAVGYILKKDINEWLEPIVEKKTYDDLEYGDKVWYIYDDGSVNSTIYNAYNCYTSSETFLTREEAEDEHKRREWTCRKDKYVPEYGDHYFVLLHNGCYSRENIFASLDYFIINSGLAFKSIDEAQEASVRNNLQKLFYTIR